MTSLSFLRQMLQDVRHQKVRTLLTLLGITWGTVSVSLLVAFGEGLQKRIEKNRGQLEAYEGSEFHDRLQRATLAASGQSAAVVFGLVTLMSTVTTSLHVRRVG